MVPELPLIYSYRPGSDVTSPLVLLVHGRAGNLGVMSLFAHSLPPHVHVVTVQAPLEDPIGGYSWWRLNTEDAPKDGMRILVSFLEAFLNTHSLTPSKKISFGFSQGGAVLSLIAQNSPELFDGIALLASFVLRDTVVEGRKLPSILMAHGRHDDVVSIDKARSGAEYLRQYGYSVELHEDDTGHKVGSQGMKALKTWYRALLDDGAGNE